MRASHRRRVVTRRVAVAGALVVSPSLLRAANRFYVGPVTGSWNNIANWGTTSGGAGGASVPGPADAALITHSDANIRLIALDVNANVATLQIGNTGLGSNTLSQTTGFNLSAGIEQIGIGVGARGAHLQSLGTNTYSNFLSIAEGMSSVATYTLTGNLNFTGTGATPGLFVGLVGNGWFFHNSGAVTAAANAPLYVGFIAGSNGTYQMVNGALTVTQESIGAGGA